MKFDHLASHFNLRPLELSILNELVSGETLSATQLAGRLSISRTSVYDLLTKLVQLGLVYETLKTGVKMFALQSPKKIALLLDEKIETINQAQKELKLVDKKFSKKAAVKPRFQLFEGKQELQQMMKDMLLYDSVTVYALWPIRKMINILGEDFIEEFHKKRIRNNIELKVIWPESQVPLIKNYPYLRAGQAFKREVRIAPTKVDFSLGYTVYKNTVRFISSSKENFGFLVESSELSEMMLSQFMMIWQLSKKWTK